MSRWEDQFEQHRVHAELKKLHDRVAQYRGTGAESEEQIEHVVGCTRYVMRRLKSVDPQLVALATLNELAQLTESASASIDAYAKSKEEAQWDAADHAAESLVLTSIKLPAVRTAKDVEGVQEAVVRFRRSAGQHLRKLGDRAAEVKTAFEKIAEKITQHESQITAQITRLDTAIQAFVSDSASAEAERAKTATEGEGQRKSAFDTAEAQREQIIEDEVEAVRAQLLEHVTESSRALTDLRSSTENEFSQLIEKQRGDAAAIMSELASLKESAKESVGIIAATGMAGGYEGTANEEKAAADRWRRVAAAAFIGVISFALLSVFWPLISEAGSDWQGITAKIYASLTFALLAAYAGREAEKHRRNERYHRQRSLELRSLNPYLEPLSPEQQSAIRSVVADRIFGRDDPNASSPAEAAPPVPTVIDALTAILTKR